MVTEKKSDILKNYEPYEEIEICTNHLKNVKFIFTFDNVSPILIGKGAENPLVWISGRKPGTFSWFYLIIENKSFNNEITVELSSKNITLIKDSSNNVLLEVESFSQSKARVNRIDLRPLGLNAFCKENTLQIGNVKFNTSSFEKNESIS